MNFLTRTTTTKLPIRIITPFLHLTKRPYLPPISTLQNSNPYSTKTTYTTTKTAFIKPKTQKSPNIPKPPSFPKPKEIPYQPKVANFVNLIGYINSPVQLQPPGPDDKKPVAATLLSQGVGEKKNSLLIPIVFVGDLANVVACHVKENDCVFVSGVLSLETLRFGFGEGLGKFHVVADNVNFVEGFKNNVSSSISSSVSVSKNVGVSEVDSKVEEVNVKGNEVVDDEEFNKTWKEATKWGKSSYVMKNEVVGNVVDVPEEVSVKPVTNVGGGGVRKKRDKDEIMDLWRNLAKNSLQWWDYREHKVNELVNKNYPDFKQKETGEGLWISSAPDWILAGFEKLEFDFKPMQGGGYKKKEGGKGGSKGDDLWTNLVENPSKWWDNRLDKRNPKAPDFKNKETGEGLWISNAPGWALSSLPPSKDGRTTA